MRVKMCQWLGIFFLFAFLIIPLSVLLNQMCLKVKWIGRGVICWLLNKLLDNFKE